MDVLCRPVSLFRTDSVLDAVRQAETAAFPRTELYAEFRRIDGTVFDHPNGQIPDCAMVNTNGALLLVHLLCPDHTDSDAVSDEQF